MSGIKISNSNMPKSLKLASSISEFLFEEELGECTFMKPSELEPLRKAVKVLIKASERTSKKKK